MAHRRRKANKVSKRSTSGMARGRQRQRLSLEQLESRQMLSVNVTQYHYDNQSTGVNNAETSLTVGNVNVNTFGKTFSTPVDGQVYAEPLYVAGVTITTGTFANTTHNVVYAATEHDGLYAIDATGGNVLWYTSFLSSSVPGAWISGATTVTSVPSGDTGSGDIQPEIGITGTPLIDTAQNALFVIAKTKQIVPVTVGQTTTNHTHYVQVLFKMNLQNGAVISSHIIGDTDTTGGYTYRTNTSASNTNQDPFVFGTGDGAITVNGQSRVYFNALRQMSRPGIMLVNGQLYTFWASHGDNGPYHGWILRFDENTLNLTGVLNTTPNGGLGGIWQGGDIAPMDLDANGQPRFFFETGNGTFDGNNGGGVVTGLNGQGFPQFGNYGDAFVAVSQDTTTTQANQNTNGWGLKVSDYFSPYNNQSLNSADADLGSGGPVVLPDTLGKIETTGPRTGLHQQLLMGGGKEGKIYLIDRNNMGKFSTTDNVVEANHVMSGHLNSPAYFNNAVYFVPGYGGGAFKLSIADGSSSYSTAAVSSSFSFGSLDGSPTISANNGSNGIVWAEDRGSNVLVAFNAATMQQLWISNQETHGRDTVPGSINKFAVPTVANGQVFIGTSNAVAGYGPPIPPTSVPADPSNPGATSNTYNRVQLTWTDNSNNEDYFSIQRSTSLGGPFTEVGEANANAVSFTDSNNLAGSTTYYYQILAHNSFNGGSYSNPTTVVSVTTPAPPPFGSGDGLLGTYYNDTGGNHLTGTPALVIVDQTINWPANTNAPHNGVGATNFSAEWTGRVQAQYNQTYTFYTESDDGVRLWIKPTTTQTWTQLVNNWTDHGTTEDSGTFAMQQGVLYDIKMDFYEGGGPWAAQLEWSSPSTAQMVIPQSQLYSGVAPAIPTNLQVVASTGVNSTITWSDNSSIETGFTLVRTNPDNSQTTITVPANTTSYFDSGLTPGQTYSYKVQANNFNGNSAFTGPVSVLMPTIPPPPSGGHATAVTTTSITLAWQLNSTTPASQETHVKVSRRVGPGTYAVIADLPAGSTSYTDNGPNGAGLTPGTFYDYHIQASNAAGDSDLAGANTDTLTLAPTSLAATPGFGLISLTWTAPTPMPSDATYSVYRGTSSGAEGGSPIASGLTSPSYADATATPGQPYFYVVRCIDAGGASAASNEVNSVAASSSVPNPASLNAVVNGTTINLNWSSVSQATSYKVYRGTSPGGEGISAIASGLTGTTFSDINRQPGVSYYYQVTAVNNSGESARSPEAVGVLAPLAPTSVTATIDPEDMNDIFVNWTPPVGVTTYDVYRSHTSGTETLYATGVTGSQYMDTNAATALGTSFYYKLVAHNAGGVSGFSNEAFVATHPAAPNAPSAAIQPAGNVALSWNSVFGASSYNVYRGTTAGNEGTVALVTGLSSPSYVDSTVSNGGSFYYKVTAVGVGGESNRSGESSVTFTAGTLRGPNNVTASAISFSQINLSWQLVSGATGYDIYRGTSAGAEGSTPINGGTPVTTVTYSDTGLTDGVTYYYTIRTRNASGSGAASNEVSAATPQRIPTATITPVGTVTTGPDTLTITFNEAVTGFTAGSGSNTVNTSALTLTRSGGPNLLATPKSLTTTDNITYVLHGLASLTTLGGPYTLKFTAAGSGVIDSQGHAAVSDSSMTYTVSPAAPEVAGVYVRGDIWQKSFKTYLANNGLGDANLGYSVMGGAGQLATLPWPSMNVISIVFSQDVNVSASSLVLTGSPGGNTVVSTTDPSTSFSYNSTTHTAVWDFHLNFPLNKYKLSIASSAVTSKANGQQLDGEWTDGTSLFNSGDTVAGGNFNFRFNVLPGDVNRSGTVDQSDVTLLKSKLLKYTTDTGYNPFIDSIGKGVITGLDYYPIQNNLGASLPTANPLVGLAAAAPAGSITSQATPVLTSTTPSTTSTTPTSSSTSSATATTGSLVIAAGQTVTLAPTIVSTATTATTTSTAGSSSSSSSTAAVDAVFSELGSVQSGIEALLAKRFSLAKKVLTY